jgi:hypothetical protein
MKLKRTTKRKARVPLCAPEVADETGAMNVFELRCKRSVCLEEFDGRMRQCGAWCSGKCAEEFA